MVKIGQSNELCVIRTDKTGFYLDGKELGEIFMPHRHAPDGIAEGDTSNVFVYIGSEGKILASENTAMAEVGQFAFLKVAQVNTLGAFLEWGVPKQLFVPYREQRPPLKPGQKCLVRIYLDEISSRIVATTKVNKWLADEAPKETKVGEEVELLLCSVTDMGYKAIVNDRFWGVLYDNEVFRELKKGDRIKGFISKIREDGRVDLSLQKKGFENVDDFSIVLEAMLSSSNGFIKLTDNSPPEEIYRILGVSKKTFKRAAGVLYRQRKIIFEKNGIKLLQND